MGERFLRQPDGTFKEYESDFNFDLKFTLETLEEYAEWDGYITPEGIFFPTKPSCTDYWNGSYNCHRDFAEDYIYCVLKEKEIDSIIRELDKQLQEKGEFLGIRGVKDYVVEYLGWVSIGHSNITDEVYTSVPHSAYFGHKPTEIQKQIALKIYEANNYDMKNYFWLFDGISPFQEDEIEVPVNEFDPTSEV